jgi:hypothetical protein
MVCDLIGNFKVFVNNINLLDLHGEILMKCGESFGIFGEKLI